MKKFQASPSIISPQTRDKPGWGVLTVSLTVYPHLLFTHVCAWGVPFIYTLWAQFVCFPRSPASCCLLLFVAFRFSFLVFSLFVWKWVQCVHLDLSLICFPRHEFHSFPTAPISFCLISRVFCGLFCCWGVFFHWTLAVGVGRTAADLIMEFMALSVFLNKKLVLRDRFLR